MLLFCVATLGGCESVKGRKGVAVCGIVDTGETPHFALRELLRSELLLSGDAHEKVLEKSIPHWGFCSQVDLGLFPLFWLTKCETGQ